MCNRLRDFLNKIIYMEFAATLPPTYLKCPVYGQNWVVADGWQVAAKKLKNQITQKIMLLCIFIMPYSL